MTIAATAMQNATETGVAYRPFQLNDVPVSCVGQAGAWIQVTKNDDTITLTPTGPMPRRCTIKPVALFENDRGIREANIVMGRLVFKSGATESKTYQPYSLDSTRRLRELFFPIEPMPEDDQPASKTRWH